MSNTPTAIARHASSIDVVTGLWDSWADDAFIRDVESGVFFDPERMHVLNHKGPISVRARPAEHRAPVQGWPVIVQAGASEAGRQIAAETAEMVFAAGGHRARRGISMPMSKAARKTLGAPDQPEDTSRRAGRSRRYRGRGAREADLLDSLVHPDSGIASLSIALGCDVSHSISMVRCPRSRKPTKAGAAGNVSSTARGAKT